MKYCGVVTPFRGMCVYIRCTMGMPGSETALEELMCRIVGNLLMEEYVTKLADLYCIEDLLLSVWHRVLATLSLANLRLSTSKTIICPKQASILGWISSEGSLSAEPHHIATLSSCQPPKTVKDLRSFIRAYKVLNCVIPNCSYF